jgi:hypothetical protein
MPFIKKLCACAMQRMRVRLLRLAKLSPGGREEREKLQWRKTQRICPEKIEERNTGGQPIA